MSGTGDDRWRGGGRGYDHNRPPGQRHQNGGYRERAMGGHQDRHGHRNQTNNNNNVTPAPAWNGPGGLAREAHVPVRAFNAAESKDALRKGYQTGGPGATPYTLYKPAGNGTSTPRSNGPSGPWASKPNSMANGKDFFLELRKQISGFQNGGNIPGG